MLFSKSVGAACALVFASVSAVAGGQSSASLSNLRFSLIDLDVEDNWTASYSLASGSSLGALSRASVRVGDQGIADGEPMYDWMSSPAPFDAVDARAAIGGAYAQASIDGGTLAASGGFDSGGALAQYDANASTGGASTAYAPGGLWTLSVSPRTVLLVSVDASASAWAGNLACETGTEANNFGSDCGPEVAVGIASMALKYRYEDGSTTASYSYSDAVRAQANVRSVYGGFRIGPEGPIGYCSQSTQTKQNQTIEH